ncbi:MAG: hypothetical protein EWM50_02705 [Gottschalkiaceae bacterium]|nr:MAG: hypothetical protein EWM50_02705 [Gottschalkiaceae bacterium]
MRDISVNLKQYGINIISDFEVRILREDDVDIDIIVPLEGRTLDLQFSNMPDYMGNRIQCSIIKNLVMRFSKSANNTICTVHLLRSIDIYSSVINFELDYKELIIQIKDLEYSAVFRILRHEKMI